MNKFKNIFSIKVNRKKFFLYSAASAVAIYSLFKMPLRFLFKGNEKSLSKNCSIKITANPNAVSRNTRGQNG